MSEESLRNVTALGRFASNDSVVLERLLPGSVEQVWSYLTDPVLLKTWLAGGTVDLYTGGALHLDFDLIECPGRETVHGTMEGIITVCNPPTLLVYTWGESGSRAAGDPDSQVAFELQPATDSQTLLTLTHTRIVTKDLPSIGAGWHVHLDVLTDRLLDRQPGHFMDAWYALEPRYRSTYRDML
jgi:uncharacterized protein YndB with AHSA1/START domain